MSFSVNASNVDTDPIPVDCDPSYDTANEVWKFIAQFAYLSIGFLVNIAVLTTIWLRYPDTYLKNSFFVLFSMDCGVNTILLLTEGFMARFLIYFTPVCMPLKDYFSSPLVFFKLIMIVIHHCKVCKSLLQSLLVLNRMTCVLFPIAHSATWRVSLPFIIPAVLIIPLSVDWNLAISRVYMQSTYGGFWMNYFKKVSWASQSRFQLIFLLIALSFTFICTFITMITLIRLPERIKQLEKSITYATVIISIGFTSTALFQIYYSFFFDYSDASSPVYGFSFLSYDFLNIGSPVVMLCVSSSLLIHTFTLKRVEEEKFFTMRSRSNH